MTMNTAIELNTAMMDLSYYSFTKARFFAGLFAVENLTSCLVHI